MFKASAVLFLFVDTPLHVGSGRGFGVVDLPIQRERVTEYPMVQASGIKGRLRAATDPELNGSATNGAANGALSKDHHLAIFGPETGNAGDHAGALSVGDARIVAFPVRSLAGVFAWTTSVHALARLRRDAILAGLTVDWTEPPEPDPDRAWVNGDLLTAGASVVLEEFSFQPDQSHATVVEAIGLWLAQHALPQGAEYRYWRDALPKKLCVLPEDAFRDFVRYATEVQTHVKLDPATKTVADKALWTSESLPADTLLYAPLMATDSRRKDQPVSADAVIDAIAGMNLARLQLGGDETTGQGMVALRVGRATEAGGNQ